MPMDLNHNPHLVDGKYGIKELVDIGELRRIFRRFTEATGFTIGFLDHPGLNILIATGWQDICTRFHRGCPASNAICLKSNRQLLGNLDQPGKMKIEQCGHGLVDCAFPIIVKGKHIASLATGQMLVETPDREKFRRQARRFGFDEQEYLKALDKVQVVSEERLQKATRFLGEIATVLSNLGYANLRIKEDAIQLKRTKEAQLKSEFQFRRLFNGSCDAINVLEPPAWKFTACNPATLKLFRMKSKAEFLAHRPWELSPERQPDGRASEEKAREMIKIALRKGSHAFEWTHRKLKGGEFQADVLLTKMEWGGKVAVQSTVRDITERKRSETALRESQNKFSILFEKTALPTALLRFSSLEYVDVNDAWLQLFGFKRAEVIGKNSIELGIYRDSDSRTRLIGEIHERKPVRNEKLNLFAKSGNALTVLAGISDVTIGGEDYILSSVQDITDKLRLEQEILSISEREQQRIAHDLHDGLGQLLVGAGLLTSALHNELKRKSSADARCLERIHEVIKEAVAQARSLARGAQPVDPAPDGLMAALHNLSEHTEQLFHVRCVFKCRRPVLMDDDQVATNLFRIAQEAVTNAIRHGKARLIKITLGRESGWISLSIENDGVGMVIRRRKKPGMGLRIMRYRSGLIGGKLSIQSKPSGGTTVMCAVKIAGNRDLKPARLTLATRLHRSGNKMKTTRAGAAKSSHQAKP